MKQDNMNEYSLPFAAWELRLYLDTHPDDAAAFAKYKALCAAMDGKCNYACHITDTRNAARENDCGCGNNTRESVRESGCDCGRNTHTMARENGCGCRNGARGIHDSNCGGGNYGGRRNDGGNFSPCTCNSCSCSDGDNDEVYNVWSWIEGPWPWEPEANNVGGNC